MESQDKQDIIKRYEDRIAQHGHSAESLGEPKGRQWFYFKYIFSMDEFIPTDSVLDIGCGYGDLYRYLAANGFTGRYVGYDIVPSFIEQAKVMEPLCHFEVRDIQSDGIAEKFDWVSACGVLTGIPSKGKFLDHLDSMIGNMWNSANKGVVFNLLSPLVDYCHEYHNREKFADALAIITKYTNRFAIRHDYMPYEYSVAMYKEATINKDLLIFDNKMDDYMAVQKKKDGIQS